MTYPYIKFELNVCNPYRDNEQKPELQIIFYFKKYLPPDFEIKGYFAFQKKLRGYLVY
jgi:hypothetical protein